MGMNPTLAAAYLAAQQQQQNQAAAAAAAQQQHSAVGPEGAEMMANIFNFLGQKKDQLSNPGP
jgi:hypothetical protein